MLQHRWSYLAGVLLATCLGSPIARACPCSEPVTDFPYTEDFENGFGLWENIAGDDFDWTRHQGSTLTTNTGPDVDHTLGTDQGYYLYTETTGNRPDKTALLLGPCIDLTTAVDPQLSFYYHMLGDSMGSLTLQISADDCDTWQSAFEMSGFQGDQWELALVDLNPYLGQTIRLRFRGLTSDGNESDMAVDDIRVGQAIAFPGGCCNLDTGACLGEMTEDECNAAGNTLWYLLEDCSEDNFCPQPPPANDLCTDATLIDSLPLNDPEVDFKWATPDLPVSCDSDGCDDSIYGVWYEYTPQEDCGARINVEANEGGTRSVITVFTGPDCDNLTEVACTSEDELLFDMTAGVTYRILVSHFWCSYQPSPSINVTFNCSKGACCLGETCSAETPTACSDYGGYYFGDDTVCTPDMCLNGACCTDTGCEMLTQSDCAAVAGEFHGNGHPCDSGVCPPLNDTCLTAEPVTDGAPAAQGNNRRADEVNDTDASCNGDSTYDLWYEYTATCTGTVIVDNEGSYIWDTILSVWNYCGGEEIGCESYGGTGALARLEFDAIAGNTYWIRFASFVHITGDFNINIACEEGPTGACCLGGDCVIDYEATCEAAGGSYDGDDSECTLEDCNANGFDDLCDLIDETSHDCNENGIPDECDIASGDSWDRNLNGVPDECDPDCNGNDIVDACDITCQGGCGDLPDCGQSGDCQGDGVPDECQLVSEACDVAILDTGYADFNTASRPDHGWSSAGVMDDFTLEDDTEGTCFRFDLFDYPGSEELQTMRIRIFEKPSTLMALGQFSQATPIFDATYSVDNEDLSITFTGDMFYQYELVRFEATGADYDLPAGDYAIHLMFPGTDHAGFWATAGSDDSDCAAIWGDSVEWPTDICANSGEDFSRLSFALLTNASHDCNDTNVPDECEYAANGDFNADGVVNADDHLYFAECLTGPFAVPTRQAPGCGGMCLMVFDADQDGDIDLLDFAIMQTAYIGSGR